MDVLAPPIDATAALQSQVCAISHELQRKFFNMPSGKEACLTQRDESRAQLDERSKKIDALRFQKSRILCQIGDRFAGESWVRSVSPSERPEWAAAVDHKRSEHLKVLDYDNSLLDQRDE